MRHPRDHTITVRPSIHAPPQPTRSACEAAVLLGTTIDPGPAIRAFSPLQISLPPGTRAIIQGPSGSGKSTFVNHLRAALRAAEWRIISPPPAIRPTLPCLGAFGAGTPVPEAMRRLARAGLADLHALTARAGTLSTGQRQRLALAIAMHRAEASLARGTRTALIIDEFASGLDPATAAGVAALLARFSAACPALRIVVASNHTHLTQWLRPTHEIRCSYGRAVPQIQTHLDPPAPIGDHPLQLFSIEQGSASDLAPLAPEHYRPGRPATISRVYRLSLRDPGAGSLPVGVLTLSQPTLNATWRDLAWPGRYTALPKRAAARRLNAEIRCISRVIIDPRYRGLGLARALVSHALEHSETQGVEAVAAMGAACPFFAAAGMTEYPLPRTERDARLLDFLHELNIEPWRLALPDAAFTRAMGTEPGALERELRRWANKSRATRASRHEPATHLFRRACRSIASEPRAYAWTRTTPGEPS